MAYQDKQTPADGMPNVQSKLVSCILGIDIGTTSVKVTLVNSATLSAITYATLNTNADCDPMFPSDDPLLLNVAPSDVASKNRLHEQDPRQIVAALYECLSTLIPTSANNVYEVEHVAISCQMHGIMFWNDAAVSGDQILYKLPSNQLSNLVTWRDQRCSSALLSRLQQVAGSTGAIHHGYGFVTLASIYTSSCKSLNISTDRQCYMHAGTVGDFVVSLLSGKTTTSTSTHLAESLGFFNTKTRSFDQESLNKIFGDADAGKITSMLPNVNDEWCIKIAVKDTPLFPLLPFQAASVGSDVIFYPAFGDNQCSILAAVSQLAEKCNIRLNDLLLQPQCVINLSTSLQIAVTLPHSSYVLTQTSDGSSCYELRSFFQREKVAVCASITGGNLLHKYVSELAQFMHATLPDLSANPAINAKTLEQSLFRRYAAVEYDKIEWKSVPQLSPEFKQFLSSLERWKNSAEPEGKQHSNEFSMQFADMQSFYQPELMFFCLCRTLAEYIADLLLPMISVDEAGSTSRLDGENLISVRNILLCGGVFDRLPIMRNAVQDVVRQKLHENKKIGNADSVKFYSGTDSASSSYGAAISVKL